MFEDKKWSESLKSEAEVFTDILTKIFGPIFKEKAHEAISTSLGLLLDKALEEGRQEVIEDPKKFELGNCEDCDKIREREYQRDESRD
jgi:hypothetical protein